MKKTTHKNWKYEGRSCFLTTLFLLCINISFGQVREFEVIDRTAIPSKDRVLIGLSRKNASTTPVNLQTDISTYKVQSNSSTFNIDRLSNVEYAQKADRIIVFGDSIQKDLEANVYAKIYSGTGTLIKSLGRIASFPYVSTFTSSGNFILVANKSLPGNKHEMVLANYDASGNKKWEKSLPDLMPVNVFSSADGKTIAAVLYNPEAISTSIYYYNETGRLLLTDNTFTGISGIEFLSSGKVVITTGNYWYLYNFATGYKPLVSGILQGNAIGRYPVTTHPVKDMFFIVSVNNEPSNTGFRIQAFNGQNGAEIAEKTFDGQPYYSSNRLANVTEDDKITLITNREIIELRIR